MASFPAKIMVDTGYWYALCDPREGDHENAVAKFDDFERSRIILPWPCLYETLRTHFVKQIHAVKRFAEIARQPNVEKLDDSEYRDDAYERTVETASKRPMSLVDMVMRLMLEDVNVRINALLTFNMKDFHDVCRKRSIYIL